MPARKARGTLSLKHARLVRPARAAVRVAGGWNGEATARGVPFNTKLQLTASRQSLARQQGRASQRNTKHTGSGFGRRPAMGCAHNITRDARRPRRCSRRRTAGRRAARRPTSSEPKALSRFVTQRSVQQQLYYFSAADGTSHDYLAERLRPPPGDDEYPDAGPAAGRGLPRRGRGCRRRGAGASSVDYWRSRTSKFSSRRRWGTRGGPSRGRTTRGRARTSTGA